MLTIERFSAIGIVVSTGNIIGASSDEERRLLALLVILLFR